MISKLLVPVALFLLWTVPGEAQSASHTFKSEQLRYSRVREAYRSAEAPLQARFHQAGLTYPPQALFLRLFKSENTLEMWARNATEDTFTLVHRYKICYFSGTPGPKRRQGDLQLPEGFYEVDRFNPASNFYLSLGINYPNRADRIHTDSGSPGGDIFIHGNCVSIGCAAMTDEQIKEIYIAAVEARNAGSAISVHIFPAKMTSAGVQQLLEDYPDRPDLQEFWKNLREGFLFFEDHRQIPVVFVNSSGWYSFCKMSEAD